MAVQRSLRWCFWVLFLFSGWGTQAWAESDWQQIDASDPFIDRNNITRAPSCSGGPKLTQEGVVPADTAFSFFFRAGDSSKLLIALDGGGACWDPNTCIGSALLGDPIYELEVDETPETLAELGGIADLDNPANPFRDYTQVFIPYCSGDTHWGSKDTMYFYAGPNGPTVPWLIHHRGFDNVVAVLEWLTRYYETQAGGAPAKVMVAGGSAGGYGALLTFPAVKEIVPRSTRTYLLTDSSNGVINADFYERALGGYAVSGGVWGVEQNIPDFLLGAFASGPDALAISTNTTLAWQYPGTRFGQYTRAWDEVQIFYLNVMKHLDDPGQWFDPAKPLQTALEWTAKARLYMHLSALAPNYRFYIGAGTEHTLLADESFYTENSAQGLFFSDWVDDMLNRRFVWRSDWRNVSCAPNCLEPGDLKFR